MITPSHMLMGAALFRRRRGTAWAAAAGGLLPDVPSFVLVLAAAVQGRGFEEIFGTLYFSESWQLIMAPSHSVPLWSVALLLGWARRSELTLAFAVSGLLHQATDFLLHADDAHRHLWPLSDWRFESPVSYWDPRFHGDLFAPVEIALAAGFAWLLLRRFPSPWLRVGLALLMVLYLGQYLAGLAWAGPPTSAGN